MGGGPWARHGGRAWACLRRGLVWRESERLCKDANFGAGLGQVYRSLPGSDWEKWRSRHKERYLQARELSKKTGNLNMRDMARAKVQTEEEGAEVRAD